MFVSQLKKVTFDNGGVGGEHQIATDEGVTSEKKHHTRALTHISERLRTGDIVYGDVGKRGQYLLEAELRESEEECDGDVVI